MQVRVRAEDLTKRYGAVNALDGVSLVAYEGEVLGIFGLSGSGKSTLVRVLGGIVKPDSGTVAIESRPGVWLDEPALDPQLTPFESLWTWATLYGIPRRRRHSAIRDMLNLVGLDEVRERRAGAFSAGMLRRLEAARALLSPSQVLLADEPMAGLDYAMRARLWEHLLVRRSAEDRTIILATSRPEDAEICDRIAVLHEGRIIACGTLAQLRSTCGTEAITIKPLDTKKLGARARGSGIVAREQEGSLVVELGPETHPADLVRQLGDEISAVRLRPRGLDSVLEELIKGTSPDERKARR